MISAIGIWLIFALLTMLILLDDDYPHRYNIKIIIAVAFIPIINMIFPLFIGWIFSKAIINKYILEGF